MGLPYMLELLALERPALEENPDDTLPPSEAELEACGAKEIVLAFKDAVYGVGHDAVSRRAPPTSRVDIGLSKAALFYLFLVFWFLFFIHNPHLDS